MLSNSIENNLLYALSYAREECCLAYLQRSTWKLPTRYQ